MPFTSNARDVSIVTNQGTGRVDFVQDASGNIQFDNTQAHAVASLLHEHRGEWFADTTGKRGSQIHKVREVRRSAPSEIESYAEEALDRAVQTGRIKADPEIRAERRGNGIVLSVKYETPDGVTQRARIPIGDV